MRTIIELKMDGFRAWIGAERGGYGETTIESPSYRSIQTELKAMTRGAGGALVRRHA